MFKSGPRLGIPPLTVYKCIKREISVEAKHASEDKEQWDVERHGSGKQSPPVDQQQLSLSYSILHVWNMHGTFCYEGKETTPETFAASSQQEL